MCCNQGKINLESDNNAPLRLFFYWALLLRGCCGDQIFHLLTPECAIEWSTFIFSNYVLMTILIESCLLSSFNTCSNLLSDRKLQLHHVYHYQIEWRYDWRPSMFLRHRCENHFHVRNLRCHHVFWALVNTKTPYFDAFHRASSLNIIAVILIVIP